MKKIVTIFKILIIFTLMIIMMQNNIFATSIDKNISMGTHIGEITQTTPVIESILGAIQVIGSVIAVLALVIIGFRYMFSSLKEKAKLKDVLIYYIVGAVMVFATSNILSIAYKLIKGLEF